MASNSNITSVPVQRHGLSGYRPRSTGNQMGLNQLLREIPLTLAWRSVVPLPAMRQVWTSSDAPEWLVSQ